MKEKYEKLLKEKGEIEEENKKMKEKKNKKINENDVNEEENKINNKNKNKLRDSNISEVDDLSRDSLYLNRFPDRSFLSPEDLLRQKRVKIARLKNLFKNKVFEMKEYLHKNFMKFYYNGIFLEMTGKIKKEDKKGDVKVVSNKNNNVKNRASIFESGIKNFQHQKSSSTGNENTNMEEMKRRVTLFEKKKNK